MNTCPEWNHEMCFYSGNKWYKKPRNEINPFLCTGKGDLPVCKE